MVRMPFCLRRGYARAVLGALCLATPLMAEDRTVLGEFFTSIGCNTCATAGPVVSGLIDAQPRFAVIEYHFGDAYATAWSDQRAAFYGVSGDTLPWFAYDGLWDAGPVETYAAKLDQRLAVPAIMDVEIMATRTGVNTYDLTILECTDPDADPLDVRTYVAVVEDHFPASPNYSRNTFRASLGTSDTTLRPGTCYIETRSLTVDPSWRRPNLRVVAWVEAPLAQYPAEVYQAAIAAVPLAGDMNCDGQTNFGDINPFVLALSNPPAYFQLYPECDIMLGDVNLDGSVNFADINPFVALLTGGQ